MSVILTSSEWDQNIIRENPSIFLVGPSKRTDIPFKSYRKDMIDLIHKEIPNCIIFNPEHDPDSGFGDPNANIHELFKNAHNWELKALNDSKIIIIGMDTDDKNMGLATRTEIGFLTETRRNLIAYIPKKSYNMGYQRELCRMKGIPICSTLTKVLDQVKKMLMVVPTVTAGKFNSVEIVANNCDPVVLRETILKQETIGAIWCFISGNDMLNFTLLKNTLDFTFHHYNNDTFAFYKWCNNNRIDPVPEYATAIGGACALILNEDDSKVLLACEVMHGKKYYKFPTGAVNSNELAIECIVRELYEELGITVNLPTKLIGGYNMKKARYNKINDYFLIFVVNILETTEIKPDGIEVLNAKWFSITDILNSNGKIDDISIFKSNITVLKDYVTEHKYLTCSLVDNKMVF